MIQKLTIKTKAQKEIIDITDEVTKATMISKVKEGLITVFTRHTTCAIIVSELEPNLESDIMRFLNLAWQLGPYKHQHGDSSHTPAHILSAVIGQSRSVPIENGELLLGTWQKIALLELYGPKEREIVIQIT